MKLHTVMALIFTCAVFSFTSIAYSQNAPSQIEKHHYNYSEWTKGLFSEAVTVTGFGNGKLIYLGGIGAEEESGKQGDIRSPKNFDGQCRYAFEKIQRVLGNNGATLKDITNMTTYLTSAKNIRAYVACRNKAFDAAGAKLPAETLLIISRLAWPPMMLEVEITAITAK